MKCHRFNSSRKEEDFVWLHQTIFFCALAQQFARLCMFCIASRLLCMYVLLGANEWTEGFHRKNTTYTHRECVAFSTSTPCAGPMLCCFL